MTTPAYQLRTNKAIDRLMLLEAIRRLATQAELEAYTYFGFGGPYLEDFRLLHENFPSMRMVSIERDEEVFKRQRFHQPAAGITLELNHLKSFLSNHDFQNDRCIFWLDYTSLEYSQFEEFALLITKVPPMSLIKITLKANPSEYQSKTKVFREKFSAVLPNPNATPPCRLSDYTALLQNMLQVAAQQVLPAGIGQVFQPIASFYYKDGMGIFTLTGVVCSETDRHKIFNNYASWSFKNLEWNPPKEINVPYLSIKERLHLQRFLPCSHGNGNMLLDNLGYRIDSDREAACTQMQQYADFYLQYPQFIRAYL